MRLSYALNQSPLYKLHSRSRLAHLLKLDLRLLETCAANGGIYRRKETCTGGKRRHLCIPVGVLSTIQTRIGELLERIEKPAYVQSGVSGRSYLTNAKEHIGAVPVVKLDIKRFFPSINQARIYRLFEHTLQCSRDVSGLLTKLCIVDGHVPIGSRVSQILALHVAMPMLDELHRLAIDNELRFSCYVDDLTWSGERATASILWKAKQIIHRHGFGYHGGKAYAHHQTKIITGVELRGAEICVPAAKIRAFLSQMKAFAELPHAQHAIEAHRLLSTAAALSQIDKIGRAHV